jgi:hypothetical protein
MHPHRRRAEHLLLRAMRLTRDGRFAAAADVYAHLAEDPKTGPREFAIAAFNRAMLRWIVGDDVGAYGDLSLVMDRPDVPQWMFLRACLARGNLRRHMGDVAGATCDFSRALHAPQIPLDHQQAMREMGFFIQIDQVTSPLQLVSTAFVSRGDARIYLGDFAGARDDITRGIHFPGAEPATIASGHLLMAVVLLYEGNSTAALEFLNAVPGAQPHGGLSKILRGVVHLMDGEWQQAMTHLQAGLELIRSLATVDEIERLVTHVERRGSAAGTPAVRQLLTATRARLQQGEAQAPMRTVRRLRLMGRRGL